MKAAQREVLLSFWKVHILHPAGERPVHGQSILKELPRHGYAISPGTLYPLLQRMEGLGWLKSRQAGRGRRARKDYRLTRTGRRVLVMIREQFEELIEKWSATEAVPGPPCDPTYRVSGPRSSVVGWLKRVG
jgi:PadR family transcriptional regulator PadR